MQFCSFIKVGRGVLLNYQLLMNLLLKKLSNRHILKTRLCLTQNLFAQVCYIEGSGKRPYLTSHMTTIEKPLNFISI